MTRQTGRFVNREVGAKRWDSDEKRVLVVIQEVRIGDMEVSIKNGGSKKGESRKKGRCSGDRNHRERKNQKGFILWDAPKKNADIRALQISFANFQRVAYSCVDA